MQSQLASGGLTSVRRAARVRSPGVELAIACGALAVWQLVRVPLEGSRAEALANAVRWRSAERTLGLDRESDLVSLAGHAWVERVLTFAYSNLHLIVIVGFLMATRLLAPRRYAHVRTAWLALHVPALVVIGAFPLASPSWLPAFGGHAPSQYALSHGSGLLANSTGAAVSEHFGYALFVAVTTCWLLRRRAAVLAFAYPAFVFVVIIATRHHYILDCLMGAATVGLGILCASALLGRAPATRVTTPASWPTDAAAIAGAGLLPWALDGVDTITSHPARPLVALPLAAALLRVGLGRRDRSPLGQDPALHGLVDGRNAEGGTVEPGGLGSRRP